MSTNVNHADRQRRALELRRMGYSLDEIARKLGYADRSGAYRLVKRALEKHVREPANELREIELQRLEVLHAAVWPAAMSGDLAAMDRVLRIMERCAKLLGLDASKKIDQWTEPESLQPLLSKEAIEECLKELGYVRVGKKENITSTDGPNGSEKTS